jgi:hypothetical protein
MAQQVAGLTAAAIPRRMLDRRAKWLIGEYESDEWTVIDTIGEGQPRTFSFRVLLPNGRLLTHEPKLYATVKEFVYWIREGAYTRIYDADRHHVYAVTMMQLAYGLVARGLSSFDKLTPHDVEVICADSAAGKDGITSASQILRSVLDGFITWDDVPKEYAQRRQFDLGTLIEALHLPKYCKRRFDPTCWFSRGTEPVFSPRSEPPLSMVF